VAQSLPPHLAREPRDGLHRLHLARERLRAWRLRAAEAAVRGARVVSLVSESIDALFALCATMFPEDNAGADPYPDNLNQPPVTIPAGVKQTHFKLGR